jgi:integrase
MPQTRIEEAKAYRQRKRQQLGNQEYKALEASKRKERRARARPTPAPAPPVAVEIRQQPAQPEEPDQATDETLDAIYDAKLAFAEAVGHTIKKTSVATTYNRVKKLHKYMTGDDMTDFDWVKKTAAVSKFILSSDKWKSQESRIQQFQSLASILKVLEGYEAAYKHYSEKSIAMRQAKTKTDDKSELTDNERANMLPWPQILKIKPDNAHDSALVGVYTLIPPRRAADFGLMRLATEAEELDIEFNYVVLNTRNKPIKFVFMNYKTSSTFKRQEFPIPRALATKLTTYIESADLQFGDFLFGRTPEAAYASFSSQITKVFKKYTGKSISVNLLRHSFITWYLKKKNLTVADKKLTALAMAHSLTTQLQYNRVDL